MNKNLSLLLKLSLILSGSCILWGPSTVAGEEPAEPAGNILRPEHGWIGVGLFYADFNTSARLDGSNGLIGTSIDLEDDLGMDSNSELWTIHAGLYLSDRWRFEAEYLDHKRASLGEAERDFNWGDQSITAGLEFVAKFELAITRLAVGYDFVQEDDYLIGASLGLHWVKSLAAIQGEGTISGTAPSDDPGFSLYVFDFDAAAISDESIPLPNIGLYGAYVLGKGWRLAARADLFFLDMGDWGGEFLSTYADLSYIAENGFYCGAGLQYLVINVDYENNRVDGSIHYRHFGPRVDVGFRF